LAFFVTEVTLLQHNFTLRNGKKGLEVNKKYFTAFIFGLFFNSYIQARFFLHSWHKKCFLLLQILQHLLCSFLRQVGEV